MICPCRSHETLGYTIRSPNAHGNGPLLWNEPRILLKPRQGGRAKYYFFWGLMFSDFLKGKELGPERFGEFFWKPKQAQSSELPTFSVQENPILTAGQVLPFEIFLLCQCNQTYQCQLPLKPWTWGPKGLKSGGPGNSRNSRFLWNLWEPNWD